MAAEQSYDCAVFEFERYRVATAVFRAAIQEIVGDQTARDGGVEAHLNAHRLFGFDPIEQSHPKPGRAFRMLQRVINVHGCRASNLVHVAQVIAGSDSIGEHLTYAGIIAQFFAHAATKGSRENGRATDELIELKRRQIAGEVSTIEYMGCMLQGGEVPLRNVATKHAAVEQHAHVGHAGYVPIADRLGEHGRHKHRTHGDHIGHIPLGNIAIELGVRKGRMHAGNTRYVPAREVTLERGLEEGAAQVNDVAHVPAGHITIEGAGSKQFLQTAGIAHVPLGDIAIKGGVCKNARKVLDLGDVDMVQIAARSMPVHVVLDQFAQVLVVQSNSGRAFF